MSDTTNNDASGPPSPPSRKVSSPQPNSALNEKLYNTCDALADYMFTNERGIPDEVKPLLEGLGSRTLKTEDLANLYNALAKATAPALPDAITTMYNVIRKHGALGRLFPYRTVTILLITAIILLLLFVVLGSSHWVNSETLDVDFLNREGTAQWAASLFLLCAAGLGACLEGLFRAYSFLVTRTYDKGYDSSYLIRLVMGILAGFVLADLLYELLPLGDSKIGKPIIAIVGGFSAEAVQQILRRISETVQNLFRESLRDRMATQTLQLKAQMQARQRDVNEKAVSDLLELKKTVTEPGAAAEIDKVIKKIISNWET